VWLMTVDTGHLVFGDRMMRELGELHANLLMTPVTEIRHLLPGHFLPRTLVQLVTVEAADVAVGMGAGVPVLEVGG
jgi:hypothetical protein